MAAIKLIFGMLVGLLLIPVLIPAVIVLKVVLWPFTYKGINMSAETLAGYLRNELYDHRDDKFRWEDLENVKIRDPYLNDIRKQALAVKWPLNSSDRQKLEDLLKQLSPESARVLDATPPSASP